MTLQMRELKILHLALSSSILLIVRIRGDKKEKKKYKLIKT